MLKIDIGVGALRLPFAGDPGGGVTAWLLGLRTSENLSIARLTAGDAGITLGPDDTPLEFERRGVWMDALGRGLSLPACATWFAFTRCASCVSLACSCCFSLCKLD